MSYNKERKSKKGTKRKNQKKQKKDQAAGSGQDDPVHVHRPVTFAVLFKWR